MWGQSKQQIFWYNCINLTIIPLCENQAKRGVLPEKVWVLGTRTPALGGNVRPKELQSPRGVCH
jgi:hypothetical protein